MRIELDPNDYNSALRLKGELERAMAAVDAFLKSFPTSTKAEAITSNNEPTPNEIDANAGLPGFLKNMASEFTSTEAFSKAAIDGISRGTARIQIMQAVERKMISIAKQGAGRSPTIYRKG